MIIDVHGHMSAPEKLWAYKATLLAARGSHGRGAVRVSDDQLRESMQDKGPFVDGHLQLLKKHKTDLQLVSPRPRAGVVGEGGRRGEEDGAGGKRRDEGRDAGSHRPQTIPSRCYGRSGRERPA